jgi:hypothetical protein
MKENENYKVKQANCATCNEFAIEMIKWNEIKPQKETNSIKNKINIIYDEKASSMGD